MTDYDRRLERLEAELEPPALPLLIVTFSNSPLSEEQQIAVERRKRNWPDDGQHPIQQIHIEFVAPIETAEGRT